MERIKGKRRCGQIRHLGITYSPYGKVSEYISLSRLVRLNGDLK